MIRLGIDQLCEKRRDLLSGKRVGILAHTASVGHDGTPTVDRLAAANDFRTTTLFGPEHGIASVADDMVPVESEKCPDGNIPIYSLYGPTFESLMPTKAMLDRIDVLVIDLQDVGSRYYTYVWTAVLCLKACAAAKKKVVVCDRPNPIGGSLVEGRGIDAGYESFVGLYSLPVRHGMTIGEIVQFVNDREKVGCDLTVITMEGWRREMSWPDTGLAWVDPSPNMRSYNAALLYPGMCLLEGTNVSEGRGTDTPFEIVGAPYIDLDEIVEQFESFGLDGVHAAPTTFIPTRRKWEGKLCSGIRWVVNDAETFRPYLAGLAFVCLVARLYFDTGFDWNLAPYEFVTDKPAIDLLTGSSLLREKGGGLTIAELHELITPDPAFLEARKKALLY